MPARYPEVQDRQGATGSVTSAAKRRKRSYNEVIQMWARLWSLCKRLWSRATPQVQTPLKVRLQYTGKRYTGKRYTGKRCAGKRCHREKVREKVSGTFIEGKGVRNLFRGTARPEKVSGTFFGEPRDRLGKWRMTAHFCRPALPFRASLNGTLTLVRRSHQ
jgi:hypothetical protein